MFRERAETYAASVGAKLEPVDLSPHFEAGELLYRGAWLAERYGSFGGFIDDHPDDGRCRLLPKLFGAGASITGAEVFADQARLRTLRRRADAAWAICDAILLPTVDYIPTVAEMADSPIEANARLGRFTTFVNLLRHGGGRLSGGRRERRKAIRASRWWARPARDDWLCDLTAQRDRRPTLNGCDASAWRRPSSTWS